MASLTDEKIASNACLLIGAENINSFTDGSVEAQAAAALYERTLRSLLCERRWSFSIRQQQFSQLVNIPLVGWDKAYQIPSDFLKLWKLYPEFIQYELYGNEYVYSNYNGELIGDYTYRPDTKYLPDYFVELLEMRLAVKFSMPITEDEKKLKTMQDLERVVMARAKMADAQQRKNVGMKHFSLVDVRS